LNTSIALPRNSRAGSPATGLEMIPLSGPNEHAHTVVEHLSADLP
jgi:hypothetical protein